MPEQSTKRKPRKVAKQAPLEDDFGHLQPQDIKMEQAILGSLMIEKEAYDRVSEILKPAVFYNNSHQLIFEAIRDLEAEEKPVDFLTVTEKLDRKGQLEDIGGAFYITQLSSMVSSTAHLEYYAHIIAQKATARELIAYASDIQQKAFDATTDVDELMQEAEGALFQLSQENLKKDYTQINPVVDEAYEMLKKAAARSDGLSGLSSGFKKLDEITSGWQNSDLVILAARPAMGKTAFALNIAEYVTVKKNVTTAIFSLEMSKEQLAKRILAMNSRVDSQKLRTGDLSDREWGDIVDSARIIGETNLVIDDTPGISITELRSKCRKLKLEKNLGLVMIDYIQLMTGSKQTESRQQEISEISRSLKALAREINAPIIALSQLSRRVEQRDDKRPMLSDLRESGAIEQDADVVMFIYRDEYYNKDTETPGVTEIIIGKQRNGPIGTVRLGWKSELTKFVNIERERQ